MKLGITGYPLTYTKSPALHRGFLKEKSISGSYKTFPFDPSEGKRAFFDFLDGLRSDGLNGLNVTIPHKEWAFEYAMRRGGVAPGFEGRCAKLVQAANTLIFSKSGRVLAANTDAAGLWEDLSGWIQAGPLPEIDFDLLIVGTGGSARGALAGVLAKHEACARVRSIQFWGRDRRKTLALKRLIPAKLQKPRHVRSSTRAALVLWCLPPLEEADAHRIWQQVLTLAGQGAQTLALYDLNYGKRAACTKGLVSSKARRTGSGMLRLQANASFKLWIKPRR